MLRVADTIRTIMDFLPAPSDLRRPLIIPFSISAEPIAMNGKTYATLPSLTSSAPMRSIIGSMSSIMAADTNTDVRRPSTTEFAASFSALSMFPSPMRNEMVDAAPTPNPTPVAVMIQYMGDIIETAVMSISPRPEVQNVSTKMFSCMTRYDRESAAARERMAFLGSPSILLISLSSFFTMRGMQSRI